MTTWINDLLPIAQLVLNSAAVIGGAAIWVLYVQNLRAALEAKDATIETVEKARDFWRVKAEELEKRSPEFLETVLAERIQIRETEITRLRADRESDADTVRALEMKKSELEADFRRAQGFRMVLAMEAEDDDLPVDSSGGLVAFEEGEHSIEVEFIGEVCVDSGQLMITDPCYIDQEWISDGGPGFLPSLGVADELYPYSYNGVCGAALSAAQHGQLAFTAGHAGAGVSFATAWGDGSYPVYAEKHDGRIVRVFVTVG